MLGIIERKDLAYAWPRGETSTHCITMAADKDLVFVCKTALREGIAFLVTTKGLNKDDVYLRTPWRRTVGHRSRLRSLSSYRQAGSP